MNATMETPSAVRDGEVQLVTFYVGELLLGAEIQYVEEINRQTDLTPVARAPRVGPRRNEPPRRRSSRCSICGASWASAGPRPPGAPATSSSTREVRASACWWTASPTLSMPSGAKSKPAGQSDGRSDGRFLQGVYELDRELLAVLDIAEVLGTASDQS